MSCSGCNGRSSVAAATALSLTLLVACAHAEAGRVEGPSARGATGGPTSRATAATSPTPATMPAATMPAATMPASRPAPSTRPARDPAALRRLLRAELAHPHLARLRLSLVVAPIGRAEPLFERNGAVRRVPASNAKLLTTSAAARLLAGRYRFVTEVSVRGSSVYLWGTGDPLLKGRELVALARAARRHGVRRARRIVVDDSHFDRARLAPGFSSFSEGAYYRPTSGALNVDGNAVVIRVSAPPTRRRPRVDVLPPSDYVKVRKLIRLSRARRGRRARVRRVKVRMRPRRSRLWLTISGVFGRRARPYRSRRAVYDPGINVGWAFRRALKEQGVDVRGAVVRRARRAKHARVVARRARSLAAVIRATNRRSDNLAAETLVRACGLLPDKNGKRRRKGSWPRGLRRVHEALHGLGIRDFRLRNGSGLHRRTSVTAAAIVDLLQKVHADRQLRRRILPSLAVAGRSGTLRRRMRGTAAEGVVHAKTGTLANVLALSGYVAPRGDAPLAFSLLVNGSARRRVRRRMDHIAALLARYARGLPLEPSPATRAAR